MNFLKSESSQPGASGLQLERGDKPSRRLRTFWFGALLVLVAGIAVATLIGRSPTPVPAPSTALPLQTASNQTRVTWLPPYVDVALSPGEIGARRIAITINGTSSESYTIQAISRLAPFVTVNPPTAIVSPSGTVIVLEFAIPSSATIGQYDGTVQLRTDRRTLPSTLKVTLRVQPPTLPPDPGTAGDATLEGIDANGDGVRDDVERYIETNYPDSQSLRNMLRKEAIVTQAALIDAADRLASRAHVAAELFVQTCLRNAVGATEAQQILDALVPKLLNTAERTRVYLRRNLGSYIIDPAQFASSECHF